MSNNFCTHCEMKDTCNGDVILWFNLTTCASHSCCVNDHVSRTENYAFIEKAIEDGDELDDNAYKIKQIIEYGQHKADQ